MFANNMLGKQNFMLHSSNTTHKYLIEKMFAQVNTDLATFLRGLNSLFHSHGISFDATQYQNVILRIITPYELLSHFQIKDINDTINFKYLDFINKQQRQIPPNYKSPKQNFTINIKKTNPAFNGEKRNFNQSGAIPLQTIKTNNPKQQNKFDTMKAAELNQDQSELNSLSDLGQRKYCPRVNYGARPILQFDEEIQVQKYIIEQLQKGKPIYMQEIADEAKRITMCNKNSNSNSSNFLASIGWVRNFMRRYPKMRQLYEQSRIYKTKQRKKVSRPAQRANGMDGYYFKSMKKQEQNEQEEWKKLNGEKSNIYSAEFDQQYEQSYNYSNQNQDQSMYQCEQSGENQFKK